MWSEGPLGILQPVWVGLAAPVLVSPWPPPSGGERLPEWPHCVSLLRPHAEDRTLRLSRL